MKTEDHSDVIVYFDNQYVPLRDAKVSILTHALHYGTGVFDGIRGYWDERQEQLFLVRPMEHFRRWKANSGILRIGIRAGRFRAMRHRGGVDAPQQLPLAHVCAAAGL